MKYTLLFCISIWISFSALAQEGDIAVNDSLVKDNIYGLRIGFDLAKPIRTLVEDGYTGFEIIADFRLSNNFYAAIELGNDKKDVNEDNLTSVTKGSYAKIGFDYNMYKNWLGMNNAIHGGLRYGFSSFKHELLSYNIYTTNNVFGSDLREDPQVYSGLTSHWVEFIVGVKTEIANNLFLGINLQIKHLVTEDQPENFDNLYIPGFNRTRDFSDFGAGFGYSISYLIPIFKR
jgi:hypothetical protein